RTGRARCGLRAPRETGPKRNPGMGAIPIDWSGTGLAALLRDEEDARIVPLDRAAVVIDLADGRRAGVAAREERAALGADVVATTGAAVAGTDGAGLVHAADGVAADAAGAAIGGTRGAVLLVVVADCIATIGARAVERTGLTALAAGADRVAARGAAGAA